MIADNNVFEAFHSYWRTRQKPIKKYIKIYMFSHVCKMQTKIPIVDEGTMITWGPACPSSSKWAKNEIVCIVFPRPCKAMIVKLMICTRSRTSHKWFQSGWYPVINIMNRNQSGIVKREQTCTMNWKNICQFSYFRIFSL